MSQQLARTTNLRVLLRAVSVANKSTECKANVVMHSPCLKDAWSVLEITATENLKVKLFPPLRSSVVTLFTCGVVLQNCAS